MIHNYIYNEPRIKKYNIYRSFETENFVHFHQKTSKYVKVTY